MNLDYIRYLLAVKKYGSITKASQHLFVSQPNVSHAIKLLEADLGMKLLSRSSSGSLLTGEGLQFLSEIEPLVEQLDAVSRKYMMQDKDENLHIATLPSSMLEVSVLETIKDTQQNIAVVQKNMSGIIEGLNSSIFQYGFVYLTKELIEYFEKIFIEEKIKLHQILTHYFYFVTSRKNEFQSKTVDCILNETQNYTCVLYEDICNMDLLSTSKIVKDIVNNKTIIKVTDRTSEYLTLQCLPGTFSVSTKLPQVILDMYNLEQIPLPQYDMYYYLLYKDKIHPVIEQLMDKFKTYFI
ncbi:MAG: LysR family transcriptional regulator [Lachnospiraceae bacterium]